MKLKSASPIQKKFTLRKTGRKLPSKSKFVKFAKEHTRQIGAGVLSLFMVASLVPVQGYADSVCPSQFTIPLGGSDAYTAFSVADPNQNFQNNMKLWERSALTAPTPNGPSLAQAWQELTQRMAVTIYDQNFSDSGHYGKCLGKAEEHAMTNVASERDVISGYTTDVQYGMDKDLKSMHNANGISRCSGLQYATSLTEAARESSKTLSSLQFPSDNHWEGLSISIPTYDWGEMGSKEQDVFYIDWGTLLATNYDINHNRKGFWGAGVYFTNFHVVPMPLVDSCDATEIKDAGWQSNDWGTGVYHKDADLMSSVETNTEDYTTRPQSWKYSEKKDETFSTTTNHSSTHTEARNWSISPSIKWGIKFSEEVSADFGLSGNYGKSYSDSVSSGWSNSHTTVEGTTFELSGTHTVQPHTQGVLNAELGTYTRKISYHGPICLAFDVYMVQYTKHMRVSDKDNASPVAKLMKSFTAIEGAEVGCAQEMIYRDSLKNRDGGIYNGWWDWYWRAGDVNKYIKTCATYIPFTDENMLLTTTTKAVKTGDRGLVLTPIYPLRYLQQTKGNASYTTTYKKDLALNLSQEVEVSGYDALESSKGLVSYYGFGYRTKGHWELVERNLDGSESVIDDPNVAEIREEYGDWILHTGSEIGTIYAKYVINEDTYTSLAQAEYGQGTYTKNSDLRPVYVKITID